MTDIAHTASTARSIVFIDSRVQDAATLLQGLQPGTEVVFLQAGQDGLAQMAAALGERGDVAAVQVIAHGSAGQLWLGNSFLDNAALQRPEVQALLAALGRGLTAEGDLLVYACNTAQGTEGAQFISTLAALTGADVAASDDRTGAQGDWELEISTGSIEHAAVLSAQGEVAYQHGLATLTVTTGANSGPGTLRQAISNAVGGDTITFSAGMTVTLAGTELQISKSLTIDGDLDNDGTPDITISGNAASRVLNITSGTVVVDGLTITNGKLSAANALGAGISVTGAGTQVTILHSSLASNTATGGAGANGPNTGGSGGTAAGGMYIGPGSIVQMATTSVTGNSGTGGNGGYGDYRGGNGGNGTGGVLVSGTFRYESGTVTINGNTGSGGAGGGHYLGVPGAAGASTTNISGSADNSWVYDLPPSITGVTVPANATYVAGQNLDFTVTYNEAVTVDTVGGTPSIALTLDTGGTVQATYVTGTGTDTLTFRYTVASGNLDANGIAATNSISLNGGTIRDGASNNAAITGIAFASTTGVLVEAVAPAVSAIERVSGATSNATSVDYTVTFSESVSGVGVSDFQLARVGSASGNIASVTGSGSTYTVTVNGITGDGTLRLDLEATATGITDGAGNAIVGGFTAGQIYTFDHTAPSAPSTPDMASASDRGTFDTDNITSATTPTFTGTAEAGSIVTLYDTDGMTVQGTAVATDGAWSITSSALAEGSHSLSAKARDAVGNLSAASGVLHITIDTTPPATTFSGMALSADTGISASDFITNTAAQTIRATLSGALAGGELLNGSLDNGATWTDISSKVTGTTLTWDGVVLTGSNTLQLRVTDIAGNSGAAASKAYVLDTTAPTTSVTSVAFSADTGSVNTDFTTNTASQTITGTLSASLAAGEQVQISLDNGAVWNTATASVGSATWSLAGQTLTASNTLQARVVDAAGNAGTATSQAYVLDTTAPSFPPAGGTPADDATGVVVTDDIVLTFSEALNAADSTKVYLKDVATDTPVAATITLNGSGALVINPTASLAHSTAYYVTWDAGALQDLAGNAATAVNDETTYNFTTQAAPPSPPPPPPEPEPGPVGDEDGIPAAEENAVPGLPPVGGGTAVAGDGNGDGIKDSLQAEVASIAFVLSPTSQTNPGSAPLTFTTLVTSSQDGKVSSGASHSRITSLVQKDAPSGLPDGLDMPMGMVAFTVALAKGVSSEQFSLYVDAALGANGYWKQNSAGTWVNLASEAYGGKTVMEGGRLRLDFQIEDGGAFDADGKADGVITDPGAPAFLALSIVGVAPPVPEGGLWF